MELLKSVEKKLWEHRKYLNLYGNLRQMQGNQDFKDGYKQAMMDAFEHFQKVMDDE